MKIHWDWTVKTVGGSVDRKRNTECMSFQLKSVIIYANSVIMVWRTSYGLALPLIIPCIHISFGSANWFRFVMLCYAAADRNVYNCFFYRISILYISDSLEHYIFITSKTGKHLKREIIMFSFSIVDKTEQNRVYRVIRSLQVDDNFYFSPWN